MTYTRLDHTVLSSAVARASQLLSEVSAILEPVLVNLTEQERDALARPSVRFPAAGRALVRVSQSFPDLATRARFEADAVTEDLDNAEALAPVAQRLASLTGRVDDSRLLWYAEAYKPSLELHRVGKAVAETDGALNDLIAPLNEVFAARRKATKKLVLPGV